MNQDPQKTGERFLRGLFQRLGAEVQVHTSAPEGDQLIFLLKGDIAPLKRRADLTAAIGTLVGQVINNHDGPHYRCILDVGGGYLDRQRLLSTVAKDVARAVRKSGRRAVLDGLGPAERRVIHTALSEAKGLATRSEGEEGQRLLYVEPAERGTR